MPCLVSLLRLDRLHAAVTVLAIFACCAPAYAVSCPVLPAHTPSPAEKAYLEGNYDRSATLYQERLAQAPGDPSLTAGLTQVMLRQQKLTDAESLVEKALVAHPGSGILKTAQGEIQFRQGTPWLAASTTSAAMKLDPCYARAHLLSAQLLRINSMYGSAAKELAVAHSLDPNDPRTRMEWLGTLPLQQRIADLEALLASGTGDDAEDLKKLRFYLDHLKKEVSEPHQSCRLVSDSASATIPFARLMRDGIHLNAYGLEVKLNDHTARLQIDTGAGGLVISRSAANRAGLQRFEQNDVGGIGDTGRRAAYTAFADSIKIGALEFRNCEVEVIDQRNVVDIDGLIGMDVFSHFLVTLDYPMRNLQLNPLPPRPGDTAPAKPTLATDDTTAASSPDPNTGSQTGDAPGKPLEPARPRGPQDRYVAPEMKTWTPVYRVGHMLLIPASLNDSKPKLFILDTGAFSTSVTPSVAREVTKVHSEAFLNVKGISGNVNKVYTADNITFKFANLLQKVQDVVAFDAPAISSSAGMDISGFIGITALGQTTMSIDYRDGLVKFAYDANRGYKY